MKTIENQLKIVKLSKIFRFLCAMMLVLIPMGAFSYIVGFIAYTVHLAFLSNSLIASAPYVSSIWDYVLIVSHVIQTIIFFVAVLNLYRFFKRLSKGLLFDAVSLSHLRSAGKCWLSSWFFTVGSALIRVYALNSTPAFPYEGLLIGLAILLVAWLFREAQNLQDERQLTV